MVHNCRFEIFKINIILDPEHVLDHEMVKGLQLTSLNHHNLLVIFNFFASSNYDMPQEFKTKILLHHIYHLACLWARNHQLDRI